MKCMNSDLFKGILSGNTGPAIAQVLDTADRWADLSRTTREDAWRLTRKELRKRSKKLDRLASEVVRGLLEWKADLASDEVQEYFKKISNMLEKEYF